MLDKEIADREKKKAEFEVRKQDIFLDFFRTLALKIQNMLIF